MAEKNRFDQIEYCYLVEDTDPRAQQVKIFIPKLMGEKTMGADAEMKDVDTSAVMNEGDIGVKSNVPTQNYIIAKMQDPYAHEHKHHNCPGNCINEKHTNSCGCTSILEPCPHFHHDHHLPHEGEHAGEDGFVPAGAQMLCVIMNNNVKDIIVLRAWCRW